MPVEAALLIASTLVFIAMVLVQGVFSLREHSMASLLGARDDIADATPLTRRAKRANQNMIEAMLMFAPLIVAALVLERANDMTALGAWLFFGARLAYAPLYWIGAPILRSIAWSVGIVGVVLILLQILPFSGAA